MEKLVLMLLRHLLISKATTAVQIEQRLLDENREDDALREEGRHDAYMDIAILIDNLIMELNVK